MKHSMNRCIILGISIAALLSPLNLTLRAADAPSEQQQIAVLQSAASPQQKDAACAQLKRIGTAQSVPALADLLTDEQLSHSARYALEPMSAPEAGRALIAALEKTKGLIRAGIINSLGNRHEISAAPALAKLLADADAETVASSALALGKIGTPDALKALQTALAGTSGAAHVAVANALLTVANKSLVDGNAAGASPIFKSLYESKEKDFIRMAAYDGMIRSAGNKALGLVTAGISGNEPAAQSAALRQARDLKDAAATGALVKLLPKVPTPVQIALIGALRQRGDAAAAPAILALAKNENPDVRLPALSTLGLLGDASAVPVLAEATVSKIEAEQLAARQSLLEIKRGNVSEALITSMTSARPAVQVELARALTGRAEKTTVPKLMDLARTGAEAPRTAALRALALLCSGEHIGAMTQIVLDSKTEKSRYEAQEALGAICQRAQTKPGFDPSPIIKALATANADGRIALLQVCSGIVDARVRGAFRAGDADAKVQSALVRALCDSRDPELLPDILSAASKAGEPEVRTLAMRGYIRLATEEGSAKLSPRQRADSLKPILALANRVEEKRLVLAGLANVPDIEALKMVQPLLDETSVQSEAVLAATQIAGAVWSSDVETARTILKKIASVTTDAARKKSIETILGQMDAANAFITSWQVSGPYMQDGKDFTALFDIAFAPEKADAQGTAWRLLPAGTDPKQPWLLDLLKFLGGESRVAYVRTRVYSDKDQPARLEMGSDDGVKVWLNGKIIHANNVPRAITVGSDKVNINLKQGWNTLMLKITQNNMGWEFCAKIVNPDGGKIDGLKCDLGF